MCSWETGKAVPDMELHPPTELGTPPPMEAELLGRPEKRMKQLVNKQKLVLHYQSLGPGA